jgi:hypothetical protein
MLARVFGTGLARCAPASATSTLSTRRAT